MVKKNGRVPESFAVIIGAGSTYTPSRGDDDGYRVYLQPSHRARCKWCGRYYSTVPDDGTCRSCGGEIV